MTTQMVRLASIVMTMTAVALVGMNTGASQADSVAQRRQQVVAAAAQGAAGLPALQQALNDESSLVRRAAVRGLIDLGTAATPALTAALDNSDMLVRRAALLAIAGEPTPEALPHLEKALQDPDAGVRGMAAQLLAAFPQPNAQVTALLQIAVADKSSDVQMIAGLALAEAAGDKRPFTVQAPDRVLLRQRPDMVDHVSRITTSSTLQLPREGWKFRFDPTNRGHIENWNKADFNDSEWADGVIETAWTAGYIGVGWYRLTIDLPERPQQLAAELLFEGVDEAAWVWVNGVYVGGQDIGPAGWDQPFRVDVTEELRWGASNQITVRAMNTSHAGGIWKPIRLETLILK